MFNLGITYIGEFAHICKWKDVMSLYILESKKVKTGHVFHPGTYCPFLK